MPRKKKHSTQVEVPAHYADPKIRRARLRFIRETMGFTQHEMGQVIGMTERGVLYVESGTHVCKMAYLKLAEMALTSWRRGCIKAAKRMEEDEIRDDTRIEPLKAEALAMNAQGVSTIDIALKMRVSRQLVALWLASAGVACVQTAKAAKMVAECAPAKEISDETLIDES